MKTRNNFEIEYNKFKIIISIEIQGKKVNNVSGIIESR